MASFGQKSDKSFDLYLINQAMDEAKSFEKCCEALEQQEDCSKNPPRKFAVENDLCPFYEEIHAKAHGVFGYQQIADMIIPLWINGIRTKQSLIDCCGSMSYAEAKKHFFQDRKGVILFFERQFGVVRRISATIKYSKGGSKAGTCLLVNVEGTVASIKNEFRKQSGGKFGIAEFALYDANNVEIKDDSHLSSLESPLNLRVESRQKPFSHVSDLQDALDMCGEGTLCEPNLALDEFMPADTEKEITNASSFNKELDHAWGTYEKLKQVNPITSGNETTKRSYINPVVIAAAMISGGIQFVEELKIEGPFGNGPVDYAFKYKGAVVCVTEAKDSDMEQGLRQNIAQLAAARSSCNRKRKFTEVDCGSKFAYYGIATTSLDWQLIELKGNVVKTSLKFRGPDNEFGERERMVRAIAHVVNVLNKCKKNYESVCTAAK